MGKGKEDDKGGGAPKASQRTHGKYSGGGKGGNVSKRKSGYKGSRAKKGTRGHGK
tara:strand:- start:16 stop:180 length:165 start_codon:yes stop_codon:yes gene_type:complete